MIEATANRFLIAVLTATIALPASANTKDETCKKVGDTAYVIMVGRQGNIGLSKMIEGFADELGAHEMIIEAHEWPLFSTNESKRQAWGEFRDQMTLRCYQQE